MNSFLSLSRSFILSLLFWLISSSLYALPEDRDKPVKISAETLEWHNERQVGIYQGRVEASQGELQLESNRLTLYRGPEGQLARAVAEGSDQLAYMRDLPSLNEPQIEAWAETMDYQLEQGKIVLTGQALLIQGDDRFQGHRLTYNLNSQDLTAEKAEGEDSRIEVILTPQRSGD